MLIGVKKMQFGASFYYVFKLLNFAQLFVWEIWKYFHYSEFKP